MAEFNTHGGYFAPAGYMRINTGGSHENNPNGGVQLGVDEEGTPNLLEEGEPVYQDFVFSDNIVADVQFLIEAGVPKHYAGKLYSEIVDDLFKEAEERPNDPISKNGLDAMLSRVAQAQESQKQAEAEAEEEAALMEELKNMPPEERAALDAYFAQQQMPQEEMYPEEAIPQEGMMMQPEAPVMAMGGNLYRFGGDDDLPPTDGNLIVNPDALLQQEVHNWYEANRDRTLGEKIHDALTIDTDTVGGSGALELVGGVPVFAKLRAGAMASAEGAKTAGALKKYKAWAKNLSLKPAIEKTGKKVGEAASKTAKALDERTVAKEASNAAKKAYYSASKELGAAKAAGKETAEAVTKQAAAAEDFAKASADLRAARAAVRAADLSGAGAVAANLGVKSANAPFQVARFALKHPVGTSAGVIGGTMLYNSVFGDNAARRREKEFGPTGAVNDSTVVGAATWVPVDSYDPYGGADDWYYEDDNVERCGGKIKRANRYDWGSFLDRLNAYKVSRNPGGIAGKYRIDPNFYKQYGFNNINELEADQGYRDFTDYVLANSSDENVLNYLRALDAGTAPNVAKLFDANGNLTSNWSDLYTRRRNDQLGGIYHFYDPELMKSIQQYGEIEPAIVTPREKFVSPIDPNLVANAAQNHKGTYVGHGMYMPDSLVSAANGLLQSPVAAQTNTEVSPSDPAVKPTKERRKWNGIDTRYAGAIGSSLLALQNLIQKPDHYDYQPIRPVLPVGNIQLQDERYMPIDQNMVTNQMLANNAGNIRAIMNSGAGPGLGAQLANADFSGALALGNGLGNVWQLNNQERNRVISANNQNAAKRADFYRQLDSERTNILNNMALHNYQNALRTQVLNNQAEQDQYTAFGQNMGNALKAISYAGRENLDRNMMRGNTALGWYLDPWMNPIYKGRDWEAVSGTGACGGVLLKPYKKNK